LLTTISQERQPRNLTSTDLDTVEKLLTSIKWKDNNGEELVGLELIGIINSLFPEEYAYAESLIYGETMYADSYLQAMKEIVEKVKNVKSIMELEHTFANM
jgi:hypothetical protein